MISALATYGPVEAWPVYGRQRAELARLIETGALEAPPLVEVGDLSVETAQRAHQLQESGHIHGTRVMLVR
jgi:hypothetical protein